MDHTPPALTAETLADVITRRIVALDVEVQSILLGYADSASSDQDKQDVSTRNTAIIELVYIARHFGLAVDSPYLHSGDITEEVGYPSSELYEHLRERGHLDETGRAFK